LHSNKWSSGEKRDGNYLSQKNNSIEDLVGVEENRYLAPDPNKTMINVTNEPSDTHTHKIPQRGIMEEITEELIGKIHGYPESTRCTQEISRHQK
jgi:hypothetical protein